MVESLAIAGADRGATTPEGGTRRISRLSLHDTLVGHLRDMIIEGQLPPGSRLHEGQLGEELGVSRTPLREAIKYLASEGLVELVQSRGAVVKSTPRMSTTCSWLSAVWRNWRAVCAAGTHRTRRSPRYAPRTTR